MMKGFVKKGLVLLALGVLLAGCASSSEESSAKSSKGVEGVPMSYDGINNLLTIGDGSGAYAFVADGHSVELQNGATPCANGPDGMGTCWVRLTNRDSKYYMANAFVVFTQCASCDLTNHTMDKFDVENVDDAMWDADGNPIPSLDYILLPAITTPPGQGGPVPIWNGKGSGITYVSDAYVNVSGTNLPQPFNPFQGPTMDLSGGAVKPAWMIAPQCESVSQDWDFGGTDPTIFPFWVTLKASWFHLNPMGDNFVRGGGDDDPRFDWQNRTTVYMSLTDLTLPGSDSATRKLYRPGSIYRSNVLAGYKPSWARPFSGYTNKSTADINYTGGQKYFAVNVGIESADRMEAQSFGLQSSPVYEYYGNLAVTVSWNPEILQVFAGTTWLVARPGTVLTGSRFQGDGRALTVDPLKSQLATAAGGVLPSARTSLANDHHIFDFVTGDGTYDRGGYMTYFIHNTVWSASQVWSYFSSAEYYSWWDPATDVLTVLGDGGLTGMEPPARTIPKTFFFRGFARVRCMTENSATCVQQDGPDEDPEAWVGMHVLKVRDGKVGLGTGIRVETNHSNTGFNYYKSWDGFDTSDPIDPYSPATNAGPNRASDSGSFTVLDGAGARVIDAPGPKEYPNPKIRHRGAAQSTGSFQGWNLSVCIK